MRVLRIAASSLALLAVSVACDQAPTVPAAILPVQPVFNGLGLGSGHASDPQKPTVTTSTETVTATDTTTGLRGPGLGSGH